VRPRHPQLPARRESLSDRIVNSDLDDEEQSEQTAPQIRKRRRVQEPPTGDSKFPAAKRPNLAYTNPLANSPDSPPGSPQPAAPSALDHIDLELIEYPGGVHTWDHLKKGNFTLNVVVCKEFTKPDNIVKAVTLLSQISSGTATTVDPNTIPSSLAVSGTNPFTSLLAASQQANTHLSRVEGAISVTRMKTIMSYLVIYFTLEYAVVPRLKEENPTEGDKWVAGIKFRRFSEMLSEDSGSIVSAATIRSHCKYGRTFWEYGQSLGIASLLMFAVLDGGLATIGEVGLRGVSGMAADLTTSGTWWAFAHAMGPPTFRTLFGARDVGYKIPELIARIRAEPLPQSLSPQTIYALNEAYRRTQSQASNSSAQPPAGPPPSDEPELPEAKWQIVIGSMVLPVRRHPTTNSLAPAQVLKRNLGEWLNNTSPDDIVQDGDGNTIPFEAFRTLLPSNEISKELVNFYINVYNSKAIPGRVAIPYGSLANHFAAGSFEQFLLTLPKAFDGSKPTKIISPIDLETATIAIAIYPKESIAITYNWTNDGSLTEGIVQVSSLLLVVLVLPHLP
jgi:hypothetical protein